MIKHTSIFILITFFIVGCDLSPKKPTAADYEAKKVNSSKKDGKSNFAIVWKWATDDAALVARYSRQISEELTDLWKQNIVQNAYYDVESQVDAFDHFPNISFFLKADNEAEAKTILDKLTVVSQDIATYRVIPVGTLWLGRNAEPIKERGVTNTFAAIWTTVKSPLHGKNADVLLEEQYNAIIELWNTGVIENVYFDIEGTYESNDKTDFVFFVNANSLSDARSICESLPYFNEKIATYDIHEVAVFWLGVKEEN